MTGVSRGNIIALGLVFVILPLLLTRCSTVEHKWKEVNNHPRKTPYIFNRFNPVGTGLRTTPSGYMTKACLEKIDTSVSGGVMAVEFHKIDDSFVESIDKSVMELKKDLLEENGSSSNVIKKYDNPDLNNFIVESYKRSRRLNLLKRKPLSFMLSIKVADREITLKEETAKFRPDVLELIKDENVKGFLYTCGTDYIHAISMDSYIYFFITYYVPPEKEKKIEKMISRNISENPENTFQINIFEDIDIDFDTYFSLHLETDSVFEPAEFTFSKFHGRSIDTFLSRIV
ncbi:MAG: hypothetical protein GY754_33275, partial [bacterium]|nr:hypothetical protein [bacterium]